MHLTFVLTARVPFFPDESSGLGLSGWIAIGVAISALLFSVGAFWWIYAGRGSLAVATPRSYAFRRDDEKLLLLLPLEYYNTGAATLVVANLRGSFRHTTAEYLEWTGNWNRLPDRGDPNEWGAGEAGEALRVSAAESPESFTVAGRSAGTMVAEFQADDPSSFTQPGASYLLRIDALIHPRSRRGRSVWRKIAVFNWWSPRSDNYAVLTSHRNGRSFS